MRRFVTLAILLLFTIPFGVSISGCSKGVSITYCNGQNSGVQVGQLVTLDLEPRLTGISLNQAQIGSIAAPTGKDCKGTTVSATSVTYASTDRNIVDVNPATGSGGLCAGTWNRNSGGGIADYTVCNPNGSEGVAYITGSAQGVVSNPIAVYVHPVVTSIVLGAASTNCTTDPASNCFAVNAQSCSTGVIAAVNSYDGTACLSQGTTSQLAARSYAGTGTAENISCLVGPLSFTAQTPAVVTIDTNGLATATQPGSTTISAVNSLASSTAGYFSTCPPASITLAPAGATSTSTAPVALTQNVSKAFVATVTDTKGVALTNLTLTYVSTTPTTIPTSLNDVTPTYPGSAAITALCEPPTCNTSPFNLLGLYGNGLFVTSNPVDVTATGTNNSTILYVASTDSQYILPIDFTVSTQTSPIRLPYPPNSLVLSTDGNTIYMGTANELMVYSTTTNALTAQNTAVSGNAIALSQDNSTLVFTDPVRDLTYLYSTTSNAIMTQYGGVATRAQFSPDSTTVYITTTDGRLLVHSTFTGWHSVSLTDVASDVAITVPIAGVYLAGDPIDVRTNCPVTTVTGTGLTQTTTNVFYPDQGPVAGTNVVRIAATNDGNHMIGASTTNITDVAIGGSKKTGACPYTFTSTIAANPAIAGAVPTAITGVLPTSDSTFAFLTYTGTGSVVPEYAPATQTITNIALQTTSAGAPIAPVAGVVSSDNLTFYVGTTGDNLVHRLTRGASGFADTVAPLVPSLPAFTGTGFATPNLLAQKPRRANS